MTPPARPPHPAPQHPAPPRPTGAAGEAVPVGSRAQTTADIDLDEVTRRVYRLLQDDLRLDLTRNGR
ncbi:hypothetical protein [Deinococcus knuensis]|uniref:Uncharacterized protein n=1 Tax=Deinococcus knuensis TaxID=1837380 RepID=A0ABQ2SE58_9DEIO|nr:hypothetical protein [Deinococcus knuensis]GGS22336.1 hypothetical protein GCM10008961_12280 [Deinococcus knuensis]